MLVAELLNIGVLHRDDVVLLLLLMMMLMQLVVMKLDCLAVGIVLRRRDERRVRMLKLDFDVSDVPLHRLQRRQRVALLEQVLVRPVSAVQSQVEGLRQGPLGPLRAALDRAAAEKRHL